MNSAKVIPPAVANPLPQEGRQGDLPLSGSFGHGDRLPVARFREEILSWRAAGDKEKSEAPRLRG